MWDALDAAPVKPTPQRHRRLFDPVEVSVLVTIVLVLVCLLLPGGDFDFTHRYPTPRPDARLRFAAFAGEYMQGAVRGKLWALSILPDGRYSFRWSGCCGVYDRESGFVDSVGEQFVLSPIKPIGRQIPRQFFPVKWQRRTYLIPPDKLEELCDEIVKRKEPRYEAPGHFYVRGFADRVSGVPELPENWATYLREHLKEAAAAPGSRL